MKLTIKRNLITQVGAIMTILVTSLATVNPAVVAWLKTQQSTRLWASVLLILISAAQGIAAIKAHGVNPDGTSAAEPYQPNAAPAEELTKGGDANE